MKEVSSSDLMAKGKQQEAILDQAFDREAPTGQFSMPALNGLVMAYNKLANLMGVPDYAEFSSDVSKLPPQFVRALSMVAKAAEDYGQPGLINLSQVTNDRDLMELMRNLEKLGQDEQFAEFLGETEENTNPGMMKSSELPEPKGGMSEEPDMASLFKSRM